MKNKTIRFFRDTCAENGINEDMVTELMDLDRTVPEVHAVLELWFSQVDRAFADYGRPPEGVIPLPNLLLVVVGTLASRVKYLEEELLEARNSLFLARL